MRHQYVRIGPQPLRGELVVPPRAVGMVVFAHGSGSSHLSPHLQCVAHHLRQQRHIASLLVDMLTPTEASRRESVLDLDLQAERVLQALEWSQSRPELRGLPLGLYGVDTGAAAALIACAKRPQGVSGLVLGKGRVDLASAWLSGVQTPSLLIVGEADEALVHLNRTAHERLPGEKHLAVIPQAIPFSDDRAALQLVATLAGDWFSDHMPRRPGVPVSSARPAMTDRRAKAVAR